MHKQRSKDDIKSQVGRGLRCFRAETKADTETKRPPKPKHAAFPDGERLAGGDCFALASEDSDLASDL